MSIFSRLIIALAIVVFPCVARAGEFDLTGDLSGFTSAGDVYGPWQSLTGSYRWNAGADTPSVTLVTRGDDDRLDPTYSDAVTVDDYHDWSPRFFTYAAAGVAAGTILPTRDFYVEGDRKFGRTKAVVFGGGGGVVVNPDGVDQRYLNIGPSFYARGYNLTLRYLQTFTSGRTATGTGIAVFQTGQTGKTVGTLTLLAGDQPPNGIVAPAQNVAFGGQRALFAGIGVKHWTGPRGGVTGGFSIERLDDRATGAPIYVQRDVTIGVFRAIGPPLH